MHVFLSADDSETELRTELAESFPGISVTQIGASLLKAELATPPPQMPRLVFARQWLPNVRAVRVESIRAGANLVAERIIGVLPDDTPWMLHIEPHYGARGRHRIGARAWHSATRKTGDGSSRTHSAPEATPAIEAGRHRCELIRGALADILQKRRRHLLRQLRREPVPFGGTDSLVQLLLTAPDRGLISVAPAPVPFEQRHLLSPFPKGELPIASDKTAPSRAFAKLVEAERRFGRTIGAGETCIDLGASPGSWTYTAVSRGAHVTAVDRAPLREDLMRCPQVKFHQADAFSFVPTRPVDWLICDVIAAPEHSANLLLEWVRKGWCRHFVVTIKLRDAAGANVLTTLKSALPPLTREFNLTRLCANKKEACAFGSVK